METELWDTLRRCLHDNSDMSWDENETKVETLANWEGFVHSVDSFGLTYESLGWWMYYGWPNGINFGMPAYYCHEFRNVNCSSALVDEQMFKQRLGLS